MLIRREIFRLAIVVLLIARAFGQQQPNIREAGQNPLLGAVPQGSVSSEALPLSLADAIQRGLKNNLGAILNDQRIRAARGERAVTFSQLLPNINTRTAEASQQINLAAYGFPTPPGTASVIGPFSIFDTRATLSQSILNLRAIHAIKAGSETIRAADFSYKDTREAVVSLVTSLYLQAVAGASRIEASRAQVTAAEALYNQASDFKQAGVVPAIDVLRARVELQAQRQRLIFNQNEYEKQKLQLGRVIGLPDGQTIRLIDQVPYAAGPAITLDEALQQAYEARMDYRSLEARVRSAEQTRSAAAAGTLPSLSFNGDYGAIGKSPASLHGTYSAALALNIPVFQGGRVRGEWLQADAALQQHRAELADLRGRIGFEIRSALLDLKAAADQVEVTRSTVDLARQQEEQARDRFAAGVTNNLEVVQAQEALASANESYIASVYSYNIAKTALARATGGIEKNILMLLSGTKP
jgi:outer membrane protein TolC